MADFVCLDSLCVVWCSTRVVDAKAMSNYEGVSIQPFSQHFDVHPRPNNASSYCRTIRHMPVAMTIVSHLLTPTQ